MPTDAEVRQIRLAAIRRQIAEGTYETPEKIEAAVEKMLQRWEDDQHESESPQAPRMSK